VTWLVTVTPTITSKTSTALSKKNDPMAKAVHMMIRVRDEARSLAFYRAAFGLDIAERVAFDTFTLIYLRNAEAEFELELTVNKGRETAYDLGDGYGHLAFTVDDLDATFAHIVSAGLAPKDIKSMAHAGRPFARFFFIEDPDGYKIEVLQRSGRFV
jgi:lactoylglutathione lyase